MTERAPIDSLDERKLQQAADAVRQAEALLIGAGAGMGVDSGLPDFRGSQGFWRAYPAFEKLKLDFYALANPNWFETDPELAWGFYGHRFNLYRATAPHDGFAVLLAWARRMPFGGHVFTSNVDGHFQKAGFADHSVTEVHGSINFLQCTRSCGADVFDAAGLRIDVDEETCRARPPLPACRACGAVARPNILMFGDFSWDDVRTAAQSARFYTWLDSLHGKRLVIVECGAGMAVRTVRHTCESVARQTGGLLIRINPREPAVPDGHIGLAMKAREALHAIDGLLNDRG